MARRNLFNALALFVDAISRFGGSLPTVNTARSSEEQAMFVRRKMRKAAMLGTRRAVSPKHYRAEHGTIYRLDTKPRTGSARQRRIQAKNARRLLKGPGAA